MFLSYPRIFPSITTIISYVILCKRLITRPCSYFLGMSDKIPRRDSESSKPKFPIDAGRRKLLRTVGVGALTASLGESVVAQSDTSNGVLITAYGSADAPVSKQEILNINATAANQYRSNAGTSELVPLGRPVISDGFEAASYAIKVFDNGKSRFQASLVKEDASKVDVQAAHEDTKEFVEMVKGKRTPPQGTNTGGV